MAFSFDDIKEQIGSTWRNTWEQFQESNIYNQSKDRFENLSPMAQKATLIATAGGIALVLMSFPYGFFSQSGDYISQFESKRNVIRDLLKVSREAHDNPDVPVPPPLDAAKSQIENFFRTAQLIPEQIRGVDVVAEKSNLVPENLSQGFLKVSLAKLNLRQIVDLGYQIQAINASLKVKDIAIEANSQNPKYFDVIFKLVALNVPQEPVAPPEPPEPVKKDKKKAKTQSAED